MTVTLNVPGTNAILTGHPDGICAHPVHTHDMWFPLECKSMSIDKGNETDQHSIFAVYPEYMAQIALYGQILYDMGLTRHPQRGIFGLMDRDGRPLPNQRVPWDDQVVPRILENIATIVTDADAGNLPERPYPPGSTECRYCPYFSLCRTNSPQSEDEDPAPSTPKPPPVVTNDPRLLDAAQEWATLKPSIDKYRDLLQHASNLAGQADIIANGITAGYFHPSPRQIYDQDLLIQMVPKDILDKCRITQPDKDGFWVRPSKR